MVCIDNVHELRYMNSLYAFEK